MMKHYLKWAGLIIVALAMLCIIAIICIVMFVSPNRFKPLLIAEVMKQTSRQLVINGDLAWTFFPYLGVKTGHMALSNPAGFQQPWLVEIQSATINVRLLPLLKNKIQSEGITLHGLHLYLIKTTKGEVNWSFAKPPSERSSQAIDQTNTHFPAVITGLTISNINVTDGHVSWLDEQAKHAMKIDAFNLKATNISLLQPFPVQIEFKLNSGQPKISAGFKITSDVAISPAKTIISLRSFKLSADMQEPIKTRDVLITGDVLADFGDQTLQWSNLQVKSDQLIITGQLSVNHLIGDPSVIGHLQLMPVDLRDWLKANGQNVSNIQSLKMVTGDFDITSVNKTINIQGKCAIDNLQMNQVKLTQLTIPLHFANEVFNLSSLTANLYQGTLKANATIKFTSDVPQIISEGQLTNIQIGPLLNDLGGSKKKLKLNGVTTIDWQITTAGFDANSVIKNLNGMSHFSIADGVIEGIDIRYYIYLAKAILAQRAPSEPNTNKTEFGRLTGSASIKNGLVQNNDLLVTTPLFVTKGKGMINLINQQINYQTDTLISQSGDLENIAIPISITGNLSAPIIRFDSNEFTKVITHDAIQKAKDSLKDKIKNQGGDLLQNLLNH
jgi:AsmA protein